MPTATPEQQQVIDWVVEGQGNALVSSVAGSGKSTLITQCTNQIPLSQKVIILSFNKKIAEEMRSKLKLRIPNRFPGEPDDWKHTQAATLNSIGKRVIVNHYKWGIRQPRNVDENNEKIDDIVAALTDELYDRRTQRYLGQLDAYKKSALYPLGTPPVKPKRRPCYSAVTGLLRLSRASLYRPTQPSGSKLKDIIAFYGIEINVQLDIEWAVQALQRIETETVARFNESHQITLDEQIYMPWALNLRDPYPWDWIFVDECQDLSPLRIDLLRRISKPTTRFLFVGDNDQSIYGWTGADPRCFDRIKSEFSPVTFVLTSTFRCSHAVTKFAQKYVHRITAFEGNLKGDVLKYPNGGPLPELKSGDAVLSRLKSGLISIAIRLIRDDCKFQGFDNLLDEKTLDLLQRIYEEQTDSLRVSERLSRVAIVIETDIDLNGCTAEKVELYDLTVALKSLSEAFPGIRDFSGLRQQLHDVCKGSSEGPLLSTIHKQKGGEFDNVLIIDFSLLPLVWPGQQDWEFEQELNLVYVAITRAKDKLYLYDIALTPIPSAGIPLATRQRVVDSEQVQVASDRLLAACADVNFVNGAASDAVPLFMWESSFVRFVPGHQFQHGVRLYQVISRDGNIVIAINLNTLYAKVFAIFPRDRMDNVPAEKLISSLEDFLATCPDPTNPPRGVFLEPGMSDPSLLRDEYRRLSKLWHPDLNPSPVAAEIMQYINYMYGKSKSVS
ncbi:MAG: UvrD-helicase domain-containing protein [Cyanobium sp. LacPavin_0920_WC12_MAG_62_9]|nr:UvrD-helicase domain-containing protein [Cyanobium sp. LacPavin_0920_WC12_MAG_62_9]